MSVLSDLYKALTSDVAPTALLSQGASSIYHNWSEDAGTYPVLIYTVPSDVPLLGGDNEELYHKVTVRISICTKDAAYSGIYKELQRVMKGLGYMRKMTNEIQNDGLKILVVDYSITEKQEV